MAQNEFTHGRNDLETQYFSCGPLFTVGKSPYRRPFRLELGMMYSMNSVKIDYFRTLEDHLKESLPVVITEKYNLELIQMEMGGVLRLSKRFRLRGYMDMGVVISYAKPPSYERFIPGAGTNLVTSGFDLPPILLRGGAMLLFNLFPQRDCNIDDAPKRSKRK